MDVAKCWVSHPDEWQPKLSEWAAAEPELVRLQAWPQYGGEVVRAVTICRGSADKPFRLVTAVPHAHEPAQTAASVDLASQLITGRRLDGSPGDLDRERILDVALVSVVPDTNCQGRARSPRRVWEGGLTNEEFLKVAFGIAANGERFGRYPAWRASEHHPQFVGIEYEALDDDLYVEPNTDRRSTHTKALDDLCAELGLTHYADLHQHEGNDAVLLPAVFDDLPPERQAELTEWGQAIEAGWLAAGIVPVGQMNVPYRGQPRQQQFKDYWAGRCPGLRKITIECRNNAHRESREPTPLERQFRSATAALRATVEWGVARFG